MDNVHVVEKTVFDFSFESEEEAFDLQEGLGPFVKDRLMETVNDVFDEFSTVRRTVKIDRLEIDLGEFEEVSFMEDRLRESLRAALQEKLHKSPGPEEGVVNSEDSDFEAIKFFLLNGRLPWTHGLRSSVSIDKIYGAIVSSKGRMLVDFLNKTSRRDMVIKRLVSQFHQQVPSGIARIVAPGHYSYFEEIVRSILNSLNSPAPAGKGGGWPLLIREAAVDELLKLEGAFPGEKAMSARIMKNLARRSGGVLPPGREMNEGSENRKGSHLDFVRLRIEEALITGSSEEIKGIWPEIVGDYRALFLEELRRHGVRVSVRRKVATGFGEPLLKEIVRLIEPVEAGFICDVVDRRQVFRMALNKPPQEEGGLKGRFWEFTLAYLLVERGGRFNKKAYMGSLTRQMAAHGNMKYEDLIASLADVLKKSPGDGRIREEMLGLLGELADENAGTGALMERDDKKGEKKAADARRMELLKWRIEEALITGSAEGMKEFWPEIVRDKSALFLEQLRRYGARVLVRRKMSRGFGDILLKEIVCLIEPVEGVFICKVIDRHEFFRPALNKAYEGEGVLKGRLWEFTLGYLLVERGSRFNKRAYMGSMVRQMAAHGNISHAELIGSLLDLIKKSSGHGGLREEMLGLLGELADIAGDGPLTGAGAKEGEKNGPHEDRSELLKWHIEEALITGSAEGIKDIWSEIVRDEKALFLEQLHRYGMRVAVRRKVAAGFPDSLLKEIVCLIEPVEGGFIYDMAGKREIFQKAAGKVKTDEGGFKRRFWEFTLAFLLVERGSRFNKKSYMGSMVRQMAAHSNVKYVDFVASLKELLETGGGRHNREMLQLLGELSEDVKAPEGDAKILPGDEVLPSAELLRSYDLIEEVKQFFAGNRANVDFEKILDELLRKFPRKILELFREMQSGRIDTLKAVSYLSAKELSRFVEAVISLAGGGVENSDLALAIADYEKKIKNLKKYYLHILQNLLSGNEIDFEKIVTLNHGKEDEKETSSAVLKDIDVQPPSPLAEGEGETLLERLAAGKTLSATEKVSLISWARGLMSLRAERFKYLVERLMEEKENLKRLISIFPAPLLARLLFLLRGERYSKLLRCADLISAACINMEKGLNKRLIDSLKWQFLFNYIYKEGQSLNEAQLARSFSKYLAVKTGKREDAFNTSLAEQLAADALPSTADLHRRTMEALTKEDERQENAPPDVELEEVQDNAVSLLDEEEEFTEEIYIANAGQVLAAPYLPRLFDMLGLMDAGKFKDRSAAERAVHLLQFMVNGSESTPEYQLVLNKILCGVKTGIPICREITASAAEKEAVEGLIKGMIQNWTAIGDTSVAGFRESFLQREGVLRLKDDAWSLLVEEKPFDMLLDRLPWSFKTIKYSWMDRLVTVEWR